VYFTPEEFTPVAPAGAQNAPGEIVACEALELGVGVALAVGVALGVALGLGVGVVCITSKSASGYEAPTYSRVLQS